MSNMITKLVPRSNRAEVRNPVLALPGFKALQSLPQPARDALSNVLIDLSKDASIKAQASWSKNKAPMAAYWKAVSVYAKHLSRAIRKASLNLEGSLDQGQDASIDRNAA